MVRVRKKRVLAAEAGLLAVALGAGALFLWCAVAASPNLLVLVLSGIMFTAALIFALYLVVSPDQIRASNSEEMLSLASETLELLSRGLNSESAQAICELLLPATSGVAVAITDTTHILGYVGVSEDGNPAGKAIRTVATKETIKDGQSRIMMSAEDIGFKTEVRSIKAAIIVPIKVSGIVEGTLKFYYARPHNVNDTQRSIAEGFGEILSTQLAAARLEEQKKLATSMELRALQSQINPHFLFNTLNTIAAFIRIDPDKARVLLREFATFYRKTLENSGDVISLAREVEQVRRYFSFELARFGDERLNLIVELPESLEEILIPSFMLQPIVENSVQHAMPAEGRLTIEVRAHNEAESLFISIVDNGMGMSEEQCLHIFDSLAPRGLGIAVKNIHDRIKGYFGPESYLRYQSQEGVGTTVIFFLKDALVKEHE